MATVAGEKPLPDDGGSASGSTDNEAAKAGSDISHPHNEKDVERDAATAPRSSTTPGEGAAKAPSAPPTANDANAIPDGGLTAWLQVAGSWSLFFNTWGLLNTFGIFQTYYESGDLFTESSSNIAWIGSIQAFLLLCLSVVAGPIFDMGYLRYLVLTGSFLIVFGFMMTSLCTTFWQVVLAQGFCIGLGGSLLFIPGVAILSQYFRRRLGLAIGLAASGSSMGGVIYPIVFYQLINVEKIGFAWSTRVLGFIALATLLIPCSVMKMRVPPGRARAVIDTSAFTDLPFLTVILGCLLGFIGLYVVIFYLSFLGQARGITDDKLSFYLVPILNAASSLGRTLPNAIADKLGALNMLAPGAIVCSILVFTLISVHNIAGIIVVAIFYGFFSGVFVALPPVVIAQLTQDKSRIGTRLGMAFFAIGSAVLIGGPGGGGILGDGQPADLHWTSLFIFGGVISMAAGVVLTTLRFYRAGWKVAAKV